MELALSPEQLAFQATLRRALTEGLPSTRLRAALEGDAALWDLTVGLGVHGLLVPGSGATLVEQVLLFEEAGRVLLPGAFFSTVALAGPLLPDRATDLDGGSLRAAFAWCASDRAEEPLGPLEGGTISGVALSVLDGAGADLLLVVAEGPLLLAVPRDQPGVTTQALRVLDLTRPAATVCFDRASATVVGTAVDLQAARLSLAAEQVGGAMRCLDVALEHARTREQFGRPIGSFQAVKHALADLHVRVELARSLCWYAAWHPEDPTWTAAASSACSETYLRVAAGTIQALGGLGFTWEHDAHLHYRRARAGHAMLGTPRWHRSQIARRIAS